MTQVLEFGSVPAEERADAMHEAIRQTLVHVDIDFPSSVPPAGRATLTPVGQLTVSSIRSNAVTVSRTEKMSRDAMEPCIFLGLQLKQASLVVQNGREAALRRGDLVVWDTTAPYSLVDEGGISQQYFRVPHSALGLPRDAIRQVTARTLTPGHPITDLAASYFMRLALRPDITDVAGGEALGRPSIELIRAVIATHLDLRAVGTEALHASLRLRIFEYVRAHLGDPALNAARIAAEHHISVRHLSNVLAGGDIVLGDWLRQQRLERCRQDLADPLLASETIATIGRRWGFPDASSFARIFRAAHGVSPREWRADRVQRRHQGVPNRHGSLPADN